MDGNCMILTKKQRQSIRGDWEPTNFGKEIKIVPRHTVDKAFPKFEKMLEVINKEEIKKHPRKYLNII
jgi:hypothetical protein